MESAFALLRNLAAHSAIFVCCLVAAAAFGARKFAGVVLGLFVTPQLRNAGRCACSYKVLAARLSPASLVESCKNSRVAQSALQSRSGCKPVLYSGFRVQPLAVLKALAGPFSEHYKHPSAYFSGGASDLRLLDW